MIGLRKGKRRVPPWQGPGLLLLAGLAVVLLFAAKPAIQETPFGVCSECHEEVCADFKMARHAEVKTERWVKTAQEVESVCVNCHGDPSRHLEEAGGPGTIFSFTETGTPRSHPGC